MSHLISSAAMKVSDVLNSVQVGAVHLIFEVAPKEIIAGISFPVNMVAMITHTQSAMEINLTGHPRWHSLCVGMHHPVSKIVSTCPAA
jgi:hypothetical protein